MTTSGGRIRAALAGNPNSGKTTIFNALTGSRQHVGNYPGVTVEKKEGRFRHGGREVDVVDLPGTYSLSAHSPDELVARRFVMEERPDVVVDVVDASNLERNLYLATQFMELGTPLVLAFNMSDVADRHGFKIDTKLLSQLLGVRIVRTVGHKGKGLEELREAIISTGGEEGKGSPATVRYGSEVEEEIAKVQAKLDGKPSGGGGARWLAVKLLENDAEVTRRVGDEGGEDALTEAAEARGRIDRHFGQSAETVIADQRYGFISGACQETVRTTVESRHEMSDRIDGVLLNRFMGLPIFLALMYVVFKLTFTLGDPAMGWIEGFFGWLGEGVRSLWPVGSESALMSLLVEGVIAGVGGVIVFLPNIVLLFVAIAILEDTGYMARAAFIVDRMMHRIGLHGKSFIPMLVGFGCTVPAILATRTLETRRDRLTTILVLPLMSCGARLPIYGLLIPAFFPAVWRGPVLWVIYVTGIVLAIAMAKLLRSTLFRGEATPLVMELPPYRVPTARGILMHTWRRAWQFLKKAGTVVLGISIVMWAMTSYPQAPDEITAGLGEREAAGVGLSYSIAGRFGRALEPIMRPIGFDWKASTAMVGAFAAKEVFVAQMGIVHSVGETEDASGSLREVLREEYSPLQALCIMLFCLVSAPCMVTIVTTWRETGSWKWAALQLGGLTVLAYLLSLMVYQIGSLLGAGVIALG